MRKIFECIAVLFLICGAYADNPPKLYDTPIDELYITPEAKMRLQQVSNSTQYVDEIDVSESFKLLKQDFAARYAEAASELEEQSDGLNENDQMAIYRQFLAKQAYEDYKNYLIGELEKKSKETGRKLKKEQYECMGCSETARKNISKLNCTMPITTEYWLDRGELDSEKCNPPREMSLKDTVEWERLHACFYPDGYEDNYIIITEEKLCPGMIYNIYNTVRATFESVADDTHISYDIDLYTTWEDPNEIPDAGSDDIKNTWLTLGQDVSVYSDYQNYRNQFVQDLHDGMQAYDPVRDVAYLKLKEKKWKSSIIPGWRAYQREFNFNLSTYKSYNRQK